MPAILTLSDPGVYEHISVRYAVNELPTARVTIDNRFGRFTSASNNVAEGNDIVLSSSTDGGNTYFRAFSGSVIKKSSILAPSGRETVELSCRDDRISKLYIAFNNAVINEKDIGAAFTGSVTASDGTTWDTDSKGNHPNGLLYRSGLTYGSTVSDIFPGVSDVPLIVFQRETVFDAISRLATAYGLDWYISPTDSAFGLLRNEDDYPTVSGITISYGDNINQSTLEYDNLRSFSGILIAGTPPVFWFTGSTATVAQVIDRNITNFQEATERGREWLRLNTTSLRRGSITMPAYTFSILGKRIAVDDTLHGWTGMGDVMAVEHDILPERWTTQVSIDNVPRTPEKIYATVMQ